MRDPVPDGLRFVVDGVAEVGRGPEDAGVGDEGVAVGSSTPDATFRNMQGPGSVIYLSGVILLMASCGTAKAPTHDPALSAEMRVPFAQCVGLPAQAVGIEVDGERRVIAVEWAEDAGNVSTRSMDDCFERLDLRWVGE